MIKSEPVLTVGVALPLTILYRQSLAEMVAAGEYAYPHSDITQNHFPVEPGKPAVEAVLVHLNRNASYELVLDGMKCQGLCPGTMVEGLAFGSQYPEIQRQFPILMLGSVWADPWYCGFVGCLWGNPAMRSLFLSWIGNRWCEGFRFLAIRV